MAKLYHRRIVDGLMAIAEVPERWRDVVRALLDEEAAIAAEMEANRS